MRFQWGRRGRVCNGLLLALLLATISVVGALADPPSLTATLVTLDHQNFPFIYLNVRLDVISPAATPGLPSFAVSENGVPQTDYFQVTPPEASGGVRLVDIVFIMDNSGSMKEEQDAVWENVSDFVDDLAASGVDYALGLCRFGANERQGNPILEDAGVLTSDPRYFRNDVWGRNRVGGGYEPGWDALYEAANGFSYRPGAQRVLILITDETVTNNSRANKGARSQEEVVALLQAKSITVFSLVNLSAPYEEPDHALSDYGAISEQTNGTCFDIFSPFGEILSFVSAEAARTYLIAYRSSQPVFDGKERLVTTSASYLGAKAECEGRYIPGAAPKVQRTGETVALHEHAWAAGTSFGISAEITDTTAPFVESATLHYRRTGNAEYGATGMVYTSGIWIGTIPGAAVETPGCDYYISATDGQSTATSPAVDPRVHPHQIAVLPNRAPEIAHTPAKQAFEGTAISIAAHITDTTNAIASVRLWYREVGQLLYRSNGEMKSTGAANYEDTIPAGLVSVAGVEYYVQAVDDLGVGSSHGTFDSPHSVTILRAPVLVIPGVLGSELAGSFDGGSLKQLWPAAALGLADEASLALTSEGLEPAGSRFVVGSVVKDLLGPLPWLSYYGPLIRHLSESGYTEDQDLFTFAYDWRQDLTTTAELLATRIQTILRETGADQIDIVAHSMGGLVARQYLNSTPNTPVRKLILLGVPSHGSVDAFQTLHPELGVARGPFLPASAMQKLAASFPAAFQLLPTVTFLDLYGHIFADYYGDGMFLSWGPGPVKGSTPRETWERTYLDNVNSSLSGVNKGNYLLKGSPVSAWSFHESLSSSLRFGGETYIVAGSSRPTKGVIVKRFTFHSSGESTPATPSDYTWTALPTNGDGTVPLLSVTRLESEGPVRVFHTRASHVGMLEDNDVHELVLSILSGEPEVGDNVREEQDSTRASRERDAHVLSNTAIIVIKSPVELHIYDEAGNHIGPTPEGYIETTSDTDYFCLGDNTIAYLPEDGEYELELHGLATGSFGIEFSVFDSTAGRETKMFSLDSVPTSPAARASVSHRPSTTAAPVLHLDLDGDGTTDGTYTAMPQAAWLDSGAEVLAPAAGSESTCDEIRIEEVPELRSWLTLRSGGGSGASLWVSPVAVSLGREAVRILQKMDSARQLLVVGLLASLEADDQLEELIAAFPGNVGEFLEGLADDSLGLAARVGILLSSVSRTALTECVARDPGMLFWYERRMGALLTSASEELHILLPRYPQFQIPNAVSGFTGFVFILDEIGATPAKTAADAFLYFSAIDEIRVAPTAFTLGKANVGVGGALLPVENWFEWSYGRRMWIEPTN